jgi:lipopolysaccharide transport system ATP-binding protein
MSSEPVQIRLRNLGKAYQIYDRPQDRLKQFLARGRRRYFREFWALQGIDLEVRQGEVIGIIGRNGAGKSTLLQLLCGTLNPTQGEIEVQGRIAALLELGAGFNPEFSGRENVFLNAAILGLSQQEIEQRYPAIAEFAGIGDFIDQPVKTYSSGMFVRLAFAVATSVDPDILIIDEALSVGDGAFARKSFDRIMQLKERGATILFCSHAMYHIDALCDRALWLERGQSRMLAETGQVTAAYNAALAVEFAEAEIQADTSNKPIQETALTGQGRILKVWGEADGQKGTRLKLKSGQSDLLLCIEFILAPLLPDPSVALAIESAAGVVVTSSISLPNSGAIQRKPNGEGMARVLFPQLPLLKGEYRITFFLACEQGLHPYDHTMGSVVLDVAQDGLMQGLVSLPHQWLYAEARGGAG